MTLKQASELSGYSIPTINALELEGRGSDRLKEKLQEIYGMAERANLLRDAPPENDASLWRRRAKTAEKELSDLRRGLRNLLNSQIEGTSDSEPGKVILDRGFEAEIENTKDRHAGANTRPHSPNKKRD